MRVMHPPDQIDVLLLPGTHVLDMAAPVQVLGHQRLNTNLRYISPVSSLKCAQGLTVSDLAPLPERIAQSSWLVICGCIDIAKRLNTEPFLAARHWLSSSAHQYKVCIAICSGSVLAGVAGLLDGRRCTTHHELIGLLRLQAPLAHVVEDCLYVEDNHFLTSAGIATGLDLSLHLVSRVWGESIAAAIAREAVLYIRRDGAASQQSFWLQNRNHLQSRIHAVQDRVLADPGSDWNTATLAKVAHMSERHLRREFLEATGMTLQTYLVRARLTLAGQLLRDTRLPIDQIALRAGVGSERTLRRLWQRHEGGTPGQFRAAVLAQQIPERQC